MKLKNKILIISVIVGCLLPVFNNAFVVAVSAGHLTAATVPINQSAVVVNSASKFSEPSIAISHSSAMNICATTMPSAFETSSINLNMPANCFSLSLHRIINQQKVAVTQASNEKVLVKVATPTFVFIPNHFLPALPDASSSAIPLPPLSSPAAAWFVVALLAGVYIKKLSSRLRVTFSLSQLAMLRC